MLPCGSVYVLTVRALFTHAYRLKLLVQGGQIGVLLLDTIVGTSAWCSDNLGGINNQLGVSQVISTTAN